MNVREARRILAEMDADTELWLQDPETARCFPVDGIESVNMDYAGEITDEPIDNDYIYPAVLIGSGG